MSYLDPRLSMRISIIFLFYLLCALLFISTFFIPEDVIVVDFVALEDGPEVAIDAINNILSLAIKLCTGILAGTIALIYYCHTSNTNLSILDYFFLLCVFLSSSASYYGILLTYFSILSFSIDNKFAPDSIQFYLGYSIAFYSIVFSAVMLASAIISSVLTKQISQRELPGGVHTNG